MATAAAVVLTFGAASLLGKPASYEPDSRLSADSDWGTFFIAGGFFLLPALLMLALAFIWLQASSRALTEGVENSNAAGTRAARLTGRAIAAVIVLAVSCLFWMFFLALVQDACPTVQHNSADATCVASFGALAAYLLPAPLGALTLIFMSRNLKSLIVKGLNHTTPSG